MTEESLWGGPAELTQRFDSVLDAFRETVVRFPDAPAILYFDGVLSYSDLDRILAAEFAAIAARSIDRPSL